MESLEQQWNKAILNLNQNKEGLEGLIETTKVFFFYIHIIFLLFIRWLINNFREL